MPRTEQVVLEELREVERRLRRLRWELDLKERALLLRARRAVNINHPEARIAATRARVQEIREEITRAEEEHLALLVEFIEA